MYRTARTCARPPQTRAAAALHSAVAIEGSDADESGELFLPKAPSSGTSESSVRERTLPTPGTLWSRSSFSRQAEEPLTALSMSLSISSSCFSNHLMVLPIAVRTRFEGGAALSRFFSAVIMSTTCCRRTTRASSSWVSASRSGLSSGRIRSAKSARTLHRWRPSSRVGPLLSRSLGLAEDSRRRRKSCCGQRRDRTTFKSAGGLEDDQPR